MVHDHVTRAAQTGMPPTYIKAVVGLASVIPLIAGVRNIVAPGTPLSFIPEDDVFQAHLHGSPKDPRMGYVFQLFGCCATERRFCQLLSNTLREALVVTSAGGTRNWYNSATTSHGCK